MSSFGNIGVGPIRTGIVIRRKIEGQHESYQEAKNMVDSIKKVEEADNILASEGYRLNSIIVSVFSLVQAMGQINYAAENLVALAKGDVSIDRLISLGIDAINIFQSLRFSLAAIEILYDSLLGGTMITQGLVIVGGGRGSVGRTPNVRLW